MIAIARADDTIVYKGITVPDIKMPAQAEWGAYEVDDGRAFVVWFQRNGRRVNTLWFGPKVLGGFATYAIDAPKAVLQKLRDQLGATNVAPLHRAVRHPVKGPAVIAWCEALGLRPLLNSAQARVGFRAPLVIGSNNGGDLDGDELDDATVI